MSTTVQLKWCKKNLEKHSQAVFDTLAAEYPEMQMETVECSDMCSLCTDVPFAIRNNATISARDPRGLYIKLKQGMTFLNKEPLPGTYASVIAVQQKNL